MKFLRRGDARAHQTSLLVQKSDVQHSLQVATTRLSATSTDPRVHQTILLRQRSHVQDSLPVATTRPSATNTDPRVHHTTFLGQRSHVQDSLPVATTRPSATSTDPRAHQTFLLVQKSDVQDSLQVATTRPSATSTDPRVHQTTFLGQRSDVQDSLSGATTGPSVTGTNVPVIESSSSGHCDTVDLENNLIFINKADEIRKNCITAGGKSFNTSACEVSKSGTLDGHQHDKKEQYLLVPWQQHKKPRVVFVPYKYTAERSTLSQYAAKMNNPLYKPSLCVCDPNIPPSSLIHIQRVRARGHNGS